jgi:hypothetical protein
MFFSELWPFAFLAFQQPTQASWHPQYRIPLHQGFDQLGVPEWGFSSYEVLVIMKKSVIG